MNPEITPEPPSPPALPPPAPAVASFATTLELQPLGKPATLGNVLEALLKQPGRILHEFKQGGGKVPLLLGIAALVCLAVFGILLGTFSGGTQYWAAPVKFVLGLFVSLVICLPSLYIFSALSGMEARLSQVVGLLLASITLTSVLLLGFAPVVWIFSQSTESVAFMGFLTLAFWIISLLFGFRLLLSASGKFGTTNGYYLLVWMGIFLLVTLQMSTSLRPIIGTAPTFLPAEKKFFLEHWFQELEPPRSSESKSSDWQR